MRKPIIYVVAIFCAWGAFVSANSTVAQKIEWQKFSSDRGGFKVLFPGTPETKNEELENGTTYKASVKLDEAVYFVAYSKFEFDLGDADSQADIAMGAFASTIGADFNEKGTWKSGGKSGKWAKMYAPEPDLYATYYVLVTGSTMYQIVAAAKENPAPEKVSKKFFKSFKLD